MLFPIGDDQVDNGHKPVVSYTFIAINILVYLWQISVSEAAQAPFLAVPDELIRGEDLFAVITSIFMHGDVFHLGFNMLFFWIFADNIEATIGSKRFLIFYLLGGVVATYAHVLTDYSSTIPLLGASGAVAAVMGSYLVMFPKNRIRMILLLGFFRFSVQSVVVLGLWIVRELYMGFGSIGIGIIPAEESNVAFWAHIGGFAFGVLAGFYFKTFEDDFDEVYYIDEPSRNTRDTSEWRPLD